MPTRLVVEALNAYFSDQHVLCDVAFTAEKGHILALIGPEGSGKSTILRVINRMAEREGAQVSGRITLDGGSIFMREEDQLRTEVGLVASQPVLFPGTVFDNISSGLRLHGMRKRERLQAQVEKALKLAGMESEMQGRLLEKASRLSPSEQQMVCIARALALEPKLLLLDEPTRFMDAVATVRLEESLCALKKQCTIVFSTHFLQQAGRIADETVFLMDGQVIEWGKTGDLFYHPTDKRTEDYITGRFV